LLIQKKGRKKRKKEITLIRQSKEFLYIDSLFEFKTLVFITSTGIDVVVATSPLIKLPLFIFN